MNVQRGRLASGGSVQLPAEMREALSLADGDDVLLEVVDGEIRLRPVRDVVARVQKRLRAHIDAGVSLSDELIADRRRQSASE